MIFELVHHLFAVHTEIELEEEAERQGVFVGVHSTILDRVLSEAG